MKKKVLYILMMALMAFAVTACGSGDSEDVDAANEDYDPGQARLEAGDPKAIMDQTKNEFSRDEVTFYTYRLVDGVLSMRAKINDEAQIEDVVTRFADAFQGTQAEVLDFEVRDHGTYRIPLNEDYSDLSKYLTAE